MRLSEAIERFQCFGSECSVLVSGDTHVRSAGESAGLARQALLAWHRRFSRFSPDSELSRLNADTASVVSVSELMARFAQAAILAAGMTGGLVDATLIHEIEAAGYGDDLGEPLELQLALSLAGERRPAAASSRACWREIAVDLRRSAITRPPGVKLDSGGLAKGLFADVLAESLSGHDAFAVDCGGDIRIGGAGALARAVIVESPFDGGTLHAFKAADVGVATSGIGRRSWIDANGSPAHHLLDPSTGGPAFTGIVQVTALAPSALLAEIRAKAAILSGPAGAAAYLPHGGVIVFDDASHRVIAPASVGGAHTTTGTPGAVSFAVSSTGGSGRSPLLESGPSSGWRRRTSAPRP